jgi:D-amino-acid dehydrogenase
MQVAEKARFHGLEVNYLNKSQIQKIEPNVSINAIGAVHYECDGHTTPNEFIQQMTKYLLNKGVDICKNEKVETINESKERIISVRTDKAEYKADEVLLAAGSWTSGLAKKLRLNLPIQAGKGYRIDVNEPIGISMPAILMEAKMAVTPMNGFTRFAGTMEFSGINNTIREKRVKAIADNASKFYDGLKINAKYRSSAQCGLRPVTPDGLPYIGKSSKFKNLTIATGHAMMGWSLGPLTGKLVSQLISNKKTELDIAAFNPERKFT